ncbi:hypothetical protein LOAG_06481 [Loa loa]|uniref:Uncharacterized protein n=1 Tax=Loa loa TaxID=7209 RepID=A0A1S0TXS4_LOALO|nr:hypothetical protein LOAG_06481 [Loa loa]EFO22010.1 hypothetical protein LOAG_06481 [Loa loa]
MSGDKRWQQQSVFEIPLNGTNSSSQHFANVKYCISEEIRLYSLTSSQTRRISFLAKDIFDDLKTKIRTDIYEFFGYLFVLIGLRWSIVIIRNSIFAIMAKNAEEAALEYRQALDDLKDNNKMQINFKSGN